MKVNEFFEDFKTPFETVPFSQIQEDDYLPLLEAAISKAKEQVDLIVSNSENPTFTNTIEALEFVGQPVSKVSEIFFNLLYAETNPRMQEIAKEMSPKMTAFANDLNLNVDLFIRVKTVFEMKNQLSLTTEQKKLLDDTYKSYIRNGALLNEEEKSSLRSIDEKMANLELQFSDNSLADTKAFVLGIDNELDMEGLSESYKEEAQNLAKEKGIKEKYAITLDMPSLFPFLKFAKNRNLRKKLTMAKGVVGKQNNSFNNEGIIKELIALRHERAKLLGYNDHASYVLEERMAVSSQKVISFLNDILQKARPHAIKEVEEVKSYAFKQDLLNDLMPWDFSYYSEKLRLEKFGLDDEVLRPYFKLENVINGTFEVAKRLYGLHFIPNDKIEKYHPDVQVFEVRDESEELVAIFYGDYFPRAGKRQGAWMTSFRPQFKKDGKNIRPHICNVCNFTKSTATEPSLLTFDEVKTLFHEFGHALHGMLSDCTYPSLSGTSVLRDFVELPSQILENWTLEPQCLELFAKHFKTGEIIPSEYVKKIQDAGNFLEGYQTLRQVGFSLLDMYWHMGDPSSILDVESFEKNVLEPTRLLPKLDGSCISTSFGHIFSGGYSAGYYSYKWAEVLDAQAFERFKEVNIFSREMGDRFKKCILSRGGSDHPMNLFKEFNNGLELSVVPLLKRAGLMTS